MSKTVALCVSIALVAGLGVVAGCGDTKTKTKTTTTTNKNKTPPAEGHDHGHAHHGPHDGDLIELGTDGKYHAEMVHDEATHKITFYILDGSAKKSAPIAAEEVVVNYVKDGSPQQTKVPAAPTETDKVGESSRFESKNEELCDAICHDPKAKAQLSVMIDDKPYVGAIEHHEHDHDHKK